MVVRRRFVTLAGLVALMLGAIALQPATPAGAIAMTTITVASGQGVTPPPGGTIQDPNVQVSTDAGGTWTQAWAVDNYFGAPTFPGSHWDSPDANFMRGYGEPQTIRYRTTFTLPAGYSLPSLAGMMSSDDKSGQVLLNGNSIGSWDTSFGFDGPPKAYATTDASLFVAGTNTLEYVVVNWGGATGVDFTADITYAAGPPPPPPLPTSKDECKGGGWQGFGSVFKNQGDCVSFVATGGKNAPAH